jgi:phospholipase A-2-activating protein
LQIGYNDGENPFVVAQAFIDEHMLDQGYLGQIADYIRQRAGASGPTLGMEGASGGGSGYPSPMEVSPSYDHLPMRGYKIFDAGVDKRGLSKVIQKIHEFSDKADDPLSSSDKGSLESLCDTLAITNRYHSSAISPSELMPIRNMILGWGASLAFPALDLARMAVLHPDAAKGAMRDYWREVLDGATAMCLGLGHGAAEEVAVPMLTMRLVCNCYKGGSGSAGAAESLIDRILDCIDACAPSNNKNVRLAVATALLNTSSHMYTSSPAATTAIRILDSVGTIVSRGTYEPEAITRTFVAMGTILLIPGPCGEESKRAARERGIMSMLERVASGNDVSIAVAKEIRSILS